MVKRILQLLVNLTASFYLMKVVDQTTLTTNLQRFFIYIYFVIFIYVLEQIYKKYFVNLIDKNEKRTILIISAVCAIILLLYKGESVIPKEYMDSQVVITTSNEKNVNSNGNEVWILSININGKSLDLKTLNSSGFTLKDTGELVGGIDNKIGQCTIEIEANNNVDIIFGMHAWSGIAEINSNNKIERKDLFDENGSQYIFHAKPAIKEKSLLYKTSMAAFGYVVICCSIIFILSFLYLKLFKSNIKNFSIKIITGIFQISVMKLYFDTYGKLYFNQQFFYALMALIITSSVIFIGENILNSIMRCKGKGNIVIILILSFYWSCALFGKSIFNDLDVSLKSISIFMLLSIVMIPIMILLYSLLDNLQIKDGTTTIVKKHNCTILFAIIFVVLLISSIAFYPGIMTTDGTDQWAQAIGRSPIYDAHTPTHTIILRLCSYIWKNPYMIILVQIFTFSLIMAKLLSFFINKGFSRKLGYLVAFLIAVSPNTIAMISLMSKNIAFTIIFLWVLYQLIILLDNKVGFMNSTFNMVIFSVSLALLQLVRKNTFIAVYFVFAFLFILGIKNYEILKWKPFAIIVLSILLVKFIEGPIYTYYNVEGHVDVSSGVKEPCYMAIGAILDNELEISESDKEKLSKVLDLDLWKERYNPYNYDIFSWSHPLPKKEALNNSEVLGISFRLFKEYPIVMAKSRLDATDIIWNVVKPPYVDVSRYSVGLYFTEEVQKLLPELARDDIYQNGDWYLPKNELTPYMIQYLEKSTEHTLGDLVFWRVGIYFGLSITLLLYSVYRKKRNLLIVSLFGLFMMSSLVIALGWQIYQYVWYYSIFAITQLLYSFTNQVEEEENEVTNYNTSI